MNSQKRYMFITGAYRSGTTLVDKLLTSMEGFSIASQPFPFLLADLKRGFPQWRPTESDPYPLGTLFGERSYSRSDLDAYLSTHAISPDALTKSADALRGYSGHMTPQLFEILNQLDGGSLSDSMRQEAELLAEHISPTQSNRVVGMKEILSEEFVPYLNSMGWLTVIVVRDPRAMVRSLNLGTGRKYGGEHRPTLFHLRNWRKSVAFALTMQQEDRFLLVRYEDLVRDPNTWAQKLADLADVTDIRPVSLSNLHTQSGDPWTSNSSFAEESEREAHGWDVVDDYIERVCGPEMVAMNYLDKCPALGSADLLSYRDPFELRHRDFAPGWATSADRVDNELRRRELIEVARENEPSLIVDGAAAILNAALH